MSGADLRAELRAELGTVGRFAGKGGYTLGWVGLAVKDWVLLQELPGAKAEKMALKHEPLSFTVEFCGRLI
jgi:hypothetical protein